MKEAKQSPYKPIFRETFNSESSVLRNGGSITAVTFENGVAKFNGTNSHINYPKISNGTYTFRFRVKPKSFGVRNFFFDCRNTPVSGEGVIYIENETIFRTSGTRYVDGVESAKFYLHNTELVVSGMTIQTGGEPRNALIGSRNTLIEAFNGDIDLVEIYSGTLTPEEVSNLYNDRWNVELPPTNLLMDFNSTNGVLSDRVGNTLTPTDVSLVKRGTKYSASFNGSTSIIDTGSDIIGTKAVTVCGWVKPYSFGETAGRIIENGKFILFTSIFDNGYGFSSDSTTTLRFGTNSTVFYKWQFLAITRKTDGKVSIYLADKDLAPIIMGSADQNSGTPTAGTTNVFIGNNSGATRTFDGLIPMLSVFDGILDLNTICNIWSSTRGKII